MVEAIAAGLGHLTRVVFWLFRVALGASGPLLVCVGVQQIYSPAVWIVAGGFIIWMLHDDRTKPTESNEGVE